MIDIVEIGTDIGTYDTNVMRAQNVLSVQLGSLSYAEDFGLDLRYFLSEEFEFQNEAFKSYLLQRLAEHSIDVSSIVETVNALYNDLVFNVSGRQDSTALVR